MGERLNIPKQRDDRVRRVLDAVWRLERHRRSVLGQPESEAVSMFDRRVAYSELIRNVLHECSFEYTVEMPAGADADFDRHWYVPMVSYRRGSAEETRQLTSTGEVLYYGSGSDVPLAAGERGLDAMAEQLRWLADRALGDPEHTVIDARADQSR